MAEAVVMSVLSKLAVVTANEAQFLGGVGTKVKRVQHELTRIKCCLIDAESKKKTDERVQNWLNELRDVAYSIEDAIDTFFLKVGYKDASVLQKLMKVCKKLYIVHNLGTELDTIQNQLQEIYECRLRYGIEDVLVEDMSKGEAVKMPLRRATYYELNENQVVGMQADKDNILKLLHREQTTRLAVISIVGAGGLGKTTLARMVYKSAKPDFDYHIMLSISQQFSLTDLLTEMITEHRGSLRENQDVGDLVNELKSFLSSRRYLIILDDVWEDDVWNVLKNVLPDVRNGSRVLIISRFIEIAKTADPQMAPYELNFLDDRKSLDLLLKRSFPYQEPNEEYPINLLSVANKLSNKCQGVPLALIVLGGILSTKEPSFLAWERVLQTMNWHSEDKDCMQIITMGYEDLPYYLKACFQYLASYPEDHVISAKRLIRMWIAEGFIPLKGRTTIEIMAEDCLEELSKRRMIQVLGRCANGSIKHFQVHDLLRDLAMHEANHEGFVTVFLQASYVGNRIIRRASLQAQEKNSRFIEYVGRNTRSLFLFDKDGYFKTSLHCSNFRLLKVLEIVGRRGDQYELKSLDGLIHLKYLGLRDCKIKLFSFHRMKSLETLELRGTGYSQWDVLWKISTLRHVLVDYEQGIRGPIPKGTLLSNLQTLKWLTIERAICDVNFPNLRKFGITYYGTDEWVSITTLLQTLPLLVSLGIRGNSLPMEIVYQEALPTYQNLQSLYLSGKWPENVNVKASLLPPHLVKLTLKGSYLKQNPMPELGKLNRLIKLCLRHYVFADDWEAPIICPAGFPVLHYLQVHDLNTKDLTVAQGVMPKLTYLQVDKNTRVHLPPELQHVTVQT